MTESAKSLRAHFEKDYLAMAQPMSWVEGTFVVLWHVTLGVGAAVAAERVGEVWAAVVAVLWIGTRMRALGNIIHECVHLSFVRPKRANLIVGTVLSILDLRSFRRYRREHFYHHHFLGDAARDPDYLGERVNWVRYFKNFVPVLSYPGDSLLINALRYFWFFSVLLFAMTFKAVALYLVLPYVTSYLACRVFSDFMDHFGLAAKANEVERSRNHAFRFWVLNAILLPRSDGYHLVHHVFPRLPVRAFRKMNQLMLAKKPPTLA